VIEIVWLFLQTGLAFFLIIWMAKERTALLQRREVKWQDIALRQKAWPDRAQQIANCFENQFEKPVLFYALVVLAIITKRADLLFVVMEWLFVASRTPTSSRPRTMCRCTASSLLLEPFSYYLCGRSSRSGFLPAP
jgi:hypothetical protein